MNLCHSRKSHLELHLSHCFTHQRFFSLLENSTQKRFKFLSLSLENSIGDKFDVSTLQQLLVPLPLYYIWNGLQLLPLFFRGDLLLHRHNSCKDLTQIAIETWGDWSDSVLVSIQSAPETLRVSVTRSLRLVRHCLKCPLRVSGSRSYSWAGLDRYCLEVATGCCLDFRGRDLLESSLTWRSIAEVLSQILSAHF